MLVKNKMKYLNKSSTKYNKTYCMFIRPNKYNSGTAQNILRRYELKNLNF